MNAQTIRSKLILRVVPKCKNLIRVSLGGFTRTAIETTKTTSESRTGQTDFEWK
jgi:hypothetical protein